MKDIESREDLLNILERFYERAFADPQIGFFFTRVVPLDLETHLPIIAGFWESVLFNTHQYRKNVMAIHQHIDSLHHIEKDHLDRWVALLSATIEESYSGTKASLMIQRARSIATLMEIKLAKQ